MSLLVCLICSLLEIIVTLADILLWVYLFLVGYFERHGELKQLRSKKSLMNFLR